VTAAIVARGGPDETRRVLAVASNLKVRTSRSLGYGCGLRQRGGQAEGQAYRQRSEGHPDRAVQGAQRLQCHVVANRPRAGDVWVVGSRRYRAFDASASCNALNQPDLLNAF
jgi:hypothetical protein